MMTDLNNGSSNYASVAAANPKMTTSAAPAPVLSASTSSTITIRGSGKSEREILGAPHSRSAAGSVGTVGTSRGNTGNLVSVVGGGDRVKNEFNGTTQTSNAKSTYSSSGNLTGNYENISTDFVHNSHTSGTRMQKHASVEFAQFAMDDVVDGHSRNSLGSVASGSGDDISSDKQKNLISTTVLNDDPSDSPEIRTIGVVEKRNTRANSEPSLLHTLSEGMGVKAEGAVGVSASVSENGVVGINGRRTKGTSFGNVSGAAVGASTRDAYSLHDLTESEENAGNEGSESYGGTLFAFNPTFRSFARDGFSKREHSSVSISEGVPVGDDGNPSTVLGSSFPPHDNASARFMDRLNKESGVVPNTVTLSTRMGSAPDFITGSGGNVPSSKVWAGMLSDEQKRRQISMGYGDVNGEFSDSNGNSQMRKVMDSHYASSPARLAQIDTFSQQMPWSDLPTNGSLNGFSSTGSGDVGAGSSAPSSFRASFEDTRADINPNLQTQQQQPQQPSQQVLKQVTSVGTAGAGDTYMGASVQAVPNTNNVQVNMYDQLQAGYNSTGGGGFFLPLGGLEGGMSPTNVRSLSGVGNDGIANDGDAVSLPRGLIGERRGESGGVLMDTNTAITLEAMQLSQLAVADPALYYAFQQHTQHMVALATAGAQHGQTPQHTQQQAQQHMNNMHQHVLQHHQQGGNGGGVVSGMNMNMGMNMGLGLGMGAFNGMSADANQRRIYHLQQRFGTKPNVGVGVGGMGMMMNSLSSLQGHLNGPINAQLGGMESGGVSGVSGGGGYRNNNTRMKGASAGAGVGAGVNGIAGFASSGVSDGMGRGTNTSGAPKYNVGKGKTGCRFFMNGFCRHGTRCKYEHISPTEVNTGAAAGYGDTYNSAAGASRGISVTKNDHGNVGVGGRGSVSSVSGWTGGAGTGGYEDGTNGRGRGSDNLSQTQSQTHSHLQQTQRMRKSDSNGNSAAVTEDPNHPSVGVRTSDPLFTAARVREMCLGQHGCRSLQKRLQEDVVGGPQVTVIYNEVLPGIVGMMMDPFGNYLSQKLMEKCNSSQLRGIIEKIAPEMATIARNMHGTRAIQKLIDCVSEPEHVQICVTALKGHVVALIRDLNGNHVIQRCLYRLGCAEDKEFICDAVARHCVEVGTHRHGCCVMQRCIDFANESQKRKVVNEVIEHALVLIQDPYGNYVVQYVLGLGEQSSSDGLITKLLGHICPLAIQKFSSNVIEKCIEAAGANLRTVVVEELMDPVWLPRLLQDPYGNYVVQNAVSKSDPELCKKLVAHINPHLHLLVNLPYGKKIIMQINSYSTAFGEKLLDTGMPGLVETMANMNISNTATTTSKQYRSLGRGEDGGGVEAMPSTVVGAKRGSASGDVPSESVGAEVNTKGSLELNPTNGLDSSII
eukprot:CFRG3146T1